MGTYFEGRFKQKRARNFPKKILRHTKIRLKENYFLTASVWVADTPESNIYPTVNLTMQHNGEKVRLCFHDTAQLIFFVEELRKFVGMECTTLHLSHNDAVAEFLSYHEKDRLPPINDYTVYTVIQEKPRKGRKKRAFICDKQTGEIIETIGVEEVRQATDVAQLCKQQTETGEQNGKISEGSIRQSQGEANGYFEQVNAGNQSNP